MQIVCIHNYKLKSQLVLKLYFKVRMYIHTYSKFCVGNLLILSFDHALTIILLTSQVATYVAIYIYIFTNITDYQNYSCIAV